MRGTGGSRLFNLKLDGLAMAIWYGHELMGSWHTLGRGHAIARCSNCGAMLEVRAVDDGPDVIGGYAVWRRCPAVDWGFCPNCGAGSDWIDIGGAYLICDRCGHLFGFPAMIPADVLLHLPKGHPQRKRTTDPRDPHPGDVKRDALKAEALEACAKRGHDIGGWVERWPYSITRCTRCGRQVAVNPSPAENETDISGEALAADCD